MQKHASSSAQEAFKTFFAPLPTSSEDAVYYDREPIALAYSSDFSRLHFHDRYEIGFCEDGEGLLCSDGVFSSFSTGDVLFVPPSKAHYAHSLHADRACRLRFYYIAPDALPSLPIPQERLNALLDRIPSVLRAGEHPQALATLGGILHDGALTESKKSAILLRLSTLLLESEQTALPSDTSAARAEHAQNEATALAEFLSLHYRDEHTSAELAALFHLSESQLRRRFVAEYGLPPIAYRTVLRCKIAAELLVRSELSVAQIAERVGYASASDFYRSFRKARGISPSQYREQKKNGIIS